jgi:hypothetical protein
MAKYIGLISSDMRGKMGGVVFTRGRNGTNIKAKGIPLNPGSIGQSRARGTLVAALGRWKNLSSTNQTTWNVLASSITYYNSLAQAYSPSGQQLYMQAVICTMMNNLVTPDTAPSTAPIIPNVASATIQAFSSYLLIKAYDSTMTEISQYNIYMSRLISPGIAYPPQNLARWIGSGEAGVTINWFSRYLAIFGAPALAGYSCVLELLPYDYSTGITGTRARAVFRIST